ncbi:FAD-binding domain-containing protein [Ramaria rubella]|nr:FAD-binding domain-containing protein [Ramaria rubella]
MSLQWPLDFATSLSQYLFRPYNATAMSWAGLNDSLDGRLQFTLPPVAECMELSSGDILKQKNCWTLTGANEINDFNVYKNAQWETCQSNEDTCLLDPSELQNASAYDHQQACNIGKGPLIYVDVKTEKDVLRTLQFAQDSRMPVVVKNSGHDYSGRSTSPGSIGLWTRNLRSMSYDSQFIPSGCEGSFEKRGAITVGAGVNWGEAYEFAEQHNVLLIGGAHKTVGVAGGWLQGGGHGPLSNSLGLGVDHVLEFELITGSGIHVVANECRNTDLFFALKGGGGGTFGVILKATLETLPTRDLHAVALQIGNSSEDQRQFVKHIVENTIQYSQAGWGGYIMVGPTSILTFVNPVATETAAFDAIRPLQEFAEKHHGLLKSSTEQSFTAFFDKYIQPIPIPVGIPFIVSSRLIPSRAFGTSDSQEELVNATMEMSTNAPVSFVQATAPFDFKGHGQTSVTPAWRTALWHFTAASTWPFNASLETRKGAVGQLSRAFDTFRRIYPESGAYFNEADIHEPDHQTAFWGNNYPELIAIKTKYDPHNILTCWQCGECNSWPRTE